MWRDKLRHDAASDGADAFRTFATRLREFVSTYTPKPKPQDKPARKHRRLQRGY